MQLSTHGQNRSSVPTPSPPHALPIIPRLLPDLRRALASLYSIPLPNDDHPRPTPAQAHDFLIHIQSRNARRKIISFQQKIRDTSQVMSPQTALPSMGEAALQMGSSWLACLAILCQIHHDTGHQTFMASATERLFAAQTIVHRIRRNKAVDAIDIEIEHLRDCDGFTALQWCNHDVHVDLLVTSYREWMRHIHPGVACVLEHAYNPASTLDEEQIKLELTLLTLAAVCCFQTRTATIDGSKSQIGPLLETTASAIGTAALRLRHCAGSVAYAQDKACLVTLIRDAFHLVSSSAQGIPHHDLRMCLYASLAAIPDTTLGSSGGARGKLSMDPRLVQQSIRELRTKDLPALWSILREDGDRSTEQEIKNECLLLKTCARWAGLLPLPNEFIEYTIRLFRQHFDPTMGEHQRIALSYLLALLEGASWTVDEVISLRLGLSESQQYHQASKKRLSSRSKKRQKELVERESSDAIRVQAEDEVRHRGEMACLSILHTWDQVSAAARVSISGGYMDGEGPIGCLAAAANACMPHLLRYPDFPHGRELFQALSVDFQLLCSSSNKTIRALSFEPLFSLHRALVSVARINGRLGFQFEPLVVDHFFKCSLSLASSCEYPSNYFANLSERSDEDIEVERNDVRDVLRTVTGSGEGGSTSDAISDYSPLGVTNRVLFLVLNSCRDAVTETSCPEPALHAFSSLAKPLNFLGKHSCQGVSDAETTHILDMAIALLCKVCQSVIRAFHNGGPVTELLPRARVVNIAIASLAPMIATRCHVLWSRPGFVDSGADSAKLANVLNVALEASILSIENIPELAAESILGQEQYDIRGTMRSPGGEDHVGCLSIQRLAYENDALTGALVEATKPFVPRLCKLLLFLKSAELERGFGVHHGKGVCPQSRRILLRTICHLELASQGTGEASEILAGIFDHAVVTIASMRSLGSDETTLAKMAEATFDLAAFPPVVVSALFGEEDCGGNKMLCLEALTSSCIYGYQQHTTSEINEATVQWNRLRAALFQLLKAASNPDLPQRAVDILCACAKAECTAIAHQCNMGPDCPSRIFNDHIVSPDVVPSGLFVYILARLLHGRNTNASTNNCVGALISLRDYVIGTILLRSADPAAFVDPRPTLAEAWLQAMIELCNASDCTAEQELVLVETATSVISLLFFPTIGNAFAGRRQDSGMSLDGPHSLVLLSFLAVFFRLGKEVLHATAIRLASVIPLDSNSVERQTCNSAVRTSALIGAALFRVVQGSLPPWAVESISSVYEGLFIALGKDPALFGEFLMVSMEVRLRLDFGAVKAGDLLSGWLFHNMPSNAKDDFIVKAVELCRKDDSASWKKLKVLVKKICGGKKKDSNFKQKPSLTRWDFTRL